MPFKEFFRKNTSFILFLLLVFAFRWSFADQYHVPSGSMEPTIHVGDRILVNKLAYHFKIPFTDLIVADTEEPKRGDIVVFQSPEKEGLTLVKRLIGLPGDHLEIRNGFVKVNGQWLQGAEQGLEKLQRLHLQKEDSSTFNDLFYSEMVGENPVNVKRLPLRALTQLDTNPLMLTIPAGHYFMMGDNRDDSLDSRFWGFVPRENLKGRALRVLWNFSIADFKPKAEFDRYGKKF